MPQVEQNLAEAAKAVRKTLKTTFLDNDALAQDVAKEFGITTQELSEAVNGNMKPKQVRIRQRLYKKFNIK